MHELCRLQELMKAMGMGVEEQGDLSPGVSVEGCYGTKDVLEPRYKKIIASHGLEEDEYAVSVTCEMYVTRVVIQIPIGTTRIDVEIDATPCTYVKTECQYNCVLFYPP